MSPTLLSTGGLHLGFLLCCIPSHYTAHSASPHGMGASFTLNFHNLQGTQTCSLVSFYLYRTLAYNTCTLLHWSVVGVVQKTEFFYFFTSAVQCDVTCSRRTLIIRSAAVSGAAVNKQQLSIYLLCSLSVSTLWIWSLKGITLPLPVFHPCWSSPPTTNS